MNNNIVEENKKKSFKWWPIIIVVLLLIIGVIVYLITTGKFEKKLNPEKDNSKITDNTKETETSVKSGSLENNYRREIIANAQKFLSANDIDLEKLEDGEEIVIPGNEIIDNKEYSECQGSLVVKKYGENFSYTSEVYCPEDNKESSDGIHYMVYGGNIGDVFELENGLAVSSVSNVKRPYFTILDCDADLIVVEDDSNVKFHKTIESKYTDEDSPVHIMDVHQINNKYYIILEEDNEMNIDPYGAGSYKTNYFIMILDEEGNELKYEELKDGEYEIRLSQFLINVSDGNNAYYEGTRKREDEDLEYVIVKISEGGIETIPIEKTIDVDDDCSRQTDITNYKAGYFYGYKKDKGWGELAIDEDGIIFKMDETGQIVWEKQLCEKMHGEKDCLWIDDIEVDDKIYVSGRVHEGEELKNVFYILNLDGELETTTQLSPVPTEFYLDGPYITFKGMMYEDDTPYLVLYRKDNYEFYATVYVDLKEAKKEFKDITTQYYSYRNGKLIVASLLYNAAVVDNRVQLTFHDLEVHRPEN